MKFFIRNLTAMLLFLGLTWMGGCAKKEASNVLRLSSWGDVQENTILEGLLADFKKAHPEINVQLERVPDTQYVDKLLTQFAGNVAPDVVFVDNTNLADFYPRSLLEPLNSYIQSDPSVKLADFYSSQVKCFTVKDEIYCIPRDIAPVCLIFYNKNAFDEAGLSYPSDDWNVDDFLKTAQKLTKRDAKGTTTRWGFLDDGNLPEAWMYAFGGRFVDDAYNPTKYLLDSPEALRGIQFRGDLINKYKVMPTPASMSQQGGVGTGDLFMNGNVAMLLSGTWKIPVFRDSIKAFKWDVAMFPKGTAGQRALVGGGSGYGIISSSKRKKEAWQLVSFLSGPDGQARFAATGLIQPARIAVAQSPAFLDGKDPQNKKLLLKAVDYAVDYPRATNWREVQTSIINPALDKVWIGTDTAEQAVTKLTVELKKHPLFLQEKR
jgi:ABC-type glycerol-3-phosphate transport system substrate-binding protein